MTISNVDRAAVIKSLANKADQVSREGLETYREIGGHLNREKDIRKEDKRRNFKSWCEGEALPFSYKWATLLMKLDTEWDKIEVIKGEPGFTFEPTHNTVKGSLALLKPKPIQPKDAERIAKLAEVSPDRGSSEAEVEVAKRQIEKMAELYNTTPEKVVTSARKKVEKIELMECVADQERQAEQDLLNEIERLQALLDKHGIPY